MVASTGWLRLGQRQFLQQAGVAQGGRRLRLVDDVAQFLGAQQRHRRHRHQAGLHDGQHGQRHHHRVAAAQQHPVAGHQAQVLHQHLGRCGRPARAPARS